MFPVTRVDSTRAEAVESLGTKGKFWCRDGDRRLLFKAEERGYGEDWSEKVVCELAALLGIPHVHYEMAFDVETQVPGVVSDMMLLPGQILVHGNVLLQAVDPDYPRTVLRVRAHTVDAVFGLVQRLAPPEPRWSEGLPSGITSAVGVYCGYLMLDAWVANQDRHHENWAAIWDGKRARLAPSYDHGSSLAPHINDEERAGRLATRDQGYSVKAFARRAKSRFFASASDGRPLGTVEAFETFAAQVKPAADVWRSRLAAVDEHAVGEILGQMPPDRLSSVALAFTVQLLAENRKRILSPREDTE